MTAPQRSDPDWRAALRQRGLRLTPQRELVLHAVRALGHATPDQVLEHVQQTATGVNASTVYRTLDLLEELRLVRHTHLGHGPPTYHAATDDDHVHLVCRVCGTVTETSPDLVGGVVRELEESEGFRADVGHLAIFGTCRACAAPDGVG